jgi:hypothetical protein
MLVDPVGHGPTRPAMTRRTTGTLLRAVGDFLGLATSKRRGLPRRLAFGLLEAFLKSTILVERRRELRAEFGVLAPQFVDDRLEIVHSRNRPDPTLPITDSYKSLAQKSTGR